MFWQRIRPVNLSLVLYPSGSEGEGRNLAFMLHLPWSSESANTLEHERLIGLIMDRYDHCDLRKIDSLRDLPFIDLTQIAMDASKALAETVSCFLLEFADSSSRVTLKRSGSTSSHLVAWESAEINSVGLSGAPYVRWLSVGCSQLLTDPHFRVDSMHGPIRQRLVELSESIKPDWWSAAKGASPDREVLNRIKEHFSAIPLSKGALVFRLEQKRTNQIWAV